MTLAAAAALPSCGDQSTGPTKDLGSEEEGTLTVWGGVAAERGPGALVKAFMKKYPKIKVEYVSFVNNDQGILKLDTALQGGVPIDVYFSYGTADVVRRSKAGLAMDLTDLAAKDEKAKIFVEGEPISTKIDGRLFSIPTTHYPDFVLLNESAIEKAGIEIPYDWTVDDYHAIARELPGKAGLQTGAYNMPRLAPTTLGGNYLYKDGGKESNLDHPMFRKELELLLAMQEDKSIFTQQKIAAEKIDAYPQNYFLNGTYGMFLNGTSSLRFVRDQKNYPHDFRTTFRPYPAPSKGATYWNPGVRGDDVQISAKTQYSKAAWTFVKFWLGEGAPLVAPAGKVSPFEVDNPTDEMIANLMGPDRDRLFDVESFKKVVFAKKPMLSVRSITTAYNEIARLKRQIEEEVRMGTKQIDGAVTEMKQEADKAITKALSAR
jgi:multiple sugar transport system substrate-binding protein